jgi:hypothetical protein
MVRKLVVIYLCLCSVLMFAETGTGTKYRVATIVAVNPHASGANAASSAPSYDVSVQVGNTIYVVLYTPRLSLQTAKYAAGRQVLVLVGEKTLTYNDISGNSIEVPILARKAVAATRTR